MNYSEEQGGMWKGPNRVLRVRNFNHVCWNGVNWSSGQKKTKTPPSLGSRDQGSRNSCLCSIHLVTREQDLHREPNVLRYSTGRTCPPGRSRPCWLSATRLAALIRCLRLSGWKLTTKIRWREKCDSVWGKRLLKVFASALTEHSLALSSGIKFSLFYWMSKEGQI